MYAALDLGQRIVQAVLKRKDGKIIKEIKTKKQAVSKEIVYPYSC